MFFSSCFLEATNHPQIFCFCASLKSPKGPHADALAAHRKRGQSYDGAVTLSSFRFEGCKTDKEKYRSPLSSGFQSIITMNSEAERGPWTPSGAHERLLLRLSRNRAHHRPMDTSSNFYPRGGTPSFVSAWPRPPLSSGR